MLSTILWRRGAFLAICIYCMLPSIVVGLANEQIESYDQANEEYYDDDEDNSSKEYVPEPDPIIKKEPPFFEATELEMNVQPETNALLNCDVRNYHIHNVVVWYNKSIIVASGNYTVNDRLVRFQNNSLLIKNVNYWDGGDFYCVVMPENVTLHIQLEIAAPLVIYSNNRNITGQELTLRQGDGHVLECRAALVDELPPTIKWSINGRRAELVPAVTVDSGLLTIENIDAEHAGTYQCLADDGSKNPPHGMVVINVQYVPKVSTHRHHVNTAAGEVTELYCDYKANPIATVHWLRNGRVINYSEKYFISSLPHNNRNRSILRINEVNIDDLGEYLCQVQNTLGSNEIHVNVGYEPETPQFEDMQMEGNRVILHWLVRSKQPLSEAILDYKSSDSITWRTVSAIHTHHHNAAENIWKVSHEIELTDGEWHARVKTRNPAGWSRFSQQHSFKMINSDDDLPPEVGVLSAGIMKASSSMNLYNSVLSWKALVLCAMLTVFVNRNYSQL